MLPWIRFGLYYTSTNSKTAARASARVAKAVSLINSFFRIAQKLSVGALS